MKFELQINSAEEAKIKFKTAVDHLIEIGVFEDLSEALKEFNINLQKYYEGVWKMRKSHVEKIVKMHHVDGLYIYTNERVSIIQKGKETIEV